MRDPDYEPGPLEGGTPHEDDETEYVYVKISREDAEIVVDSLETCFLEWNSYDDARVAVIFRAALEREAQA